MGMSTHVEGFVSPESEEYQKHKKVLLACREADVSLPKETAEYFGENSTHDWVLDEKLECKIPHHEWGSDSSEGYEVIISEIPEGVYKIRFYNSY